MAVKDEHAERKLTDCNPDEIQFQISTTEMTVPFNRAEEQIVSVSRLQYFVTGAEIDGSICDSFAEEGLSFYSNDDIANRNQEEGVNNLSPISFSYRANEITINFSDYEGFYATNNANNPI